MHAAPTTKQAMNPFIRVPQPKVEAWFICCISRDWINDRLMIQLRLLATRVKDGIRALPVKRSGHLCAPPHRSEPTLIYPCPRSFKIRLNWWRIIVVSWTDRNFAGFSQICVNGQQRHMPVEGEPDELPVPYLARWVTSSSHLNRNSSKDVSLRSFFSRPDSVLEKFKRTTQYSHEWTRGSRHHFYLFSSEIISFLLKL